MQHGISLANEDDGELGLSLNESDLISPLSYTQSELQVPYFGFLP